MRNFLRFNRQIVVSKDSATTIALHDYRDGHHDYRDGHHIQQAALAVSVCFCEFHGISGPFVLKYFLATYYTLAPQACLR